VGVGGCVGEEYVVKGAGLGVYMGWAFLVGIVRLVYQI